MTRALAIACLLAACGQKGAAPPPAKVAEEPYRGAWTPRPAPQAEAVAEVNGEIIWDTEVAAWAGERRLEPRAALDELIALELLAEEARRRGLSEDPEVVQVRRRERVRRLVDQFAAGSDDPNEIPDADVRAMWQKPELQAALNHGEIREAGFARIPASARKNTPAEIEAARRLAEDLRAHVVAARPKTYDEFQKAASAFHEQRTGRALAPEKTFGITPETHADAGFKQAVLAMKTPGQISPVTRTLWGWDVIYLRQIVPPRHTTYAEAAPEIRARMLGDWRKHAFRRWLEAFLGAARVTRHDENLGRVEVDSTFGLP